MRIFVELVQSLWEAARNVLPLMLMLIVCQVLILKRSIPNVRSFGVGLAFVILGLFFFLGRHLLESHSHGRRSREKPGFTR